MIKLFLPEDFEFALLKELNGKISVYQRNLYAGENKPSYVLLKNEQGLVLNLSIRWHDVVFKFECFSLNVRLSSQEENEAEVLNAEEWDKIKCCFRFEWEYQEAQLEGATTDVKILRNDGKRKNIPENILNAGATMTGIIFWNSSTNLPVFALVHDIYDTNEITTLKSTKEINTYIDSVDVIDLEDSKEWCDLVKKTLLSHTQQI